MKQKDRFNAIKLREKGYSLAEIVQKLKVSKSTASLWVRDVSLSAVAEKRLLTRITAGQLASQKSRKARTTKKEEKFSYESNIFVKNTKMEHSHKKILCALIYYCEGNKSVRGGISFTNSDPNLMRLFLSLFRYSFDINEKKFSVCVHLHSYHKKGEQLKIWSEITNINLSQFMRPWMKPSSGMYKKEGYQGCANIRYYDTDLARELKSIAVEYMKFSNIFA